METKIKTQYELSDLMPLKQIWQKVFHTQTAPPIDMRLSFVVFRRLIMDIPKLEEFLAHKGYDPNGDTSIGDAIYGIAGEDGVDLVLALT